MSFQKRVLDEAGALAFIQDCPADKLKIEFFLFPEGIKYLPNVVIAAVTKQPAVFKHVPREPFKYDIEIILIALRDPEMLQHLPDILKFDRALLQAIQRSTDPKLNKDKLDVELKIQQKDILKYHLQALLGYQNKKELKQRLIALNPNKELLGYSSMELLQFLLKPHQLFSVLYMNAVQTVFFKTTHPTTSATEKPLLTTSRQASKGNA